jgi:sulfur relay (sulfurtransferase) complex TusBCD TusD component (DsrE family)
MANFLFTLSKDDNEAATRCFMFAKIAHTKGHQVELFLLDGGVLWADKARDLSRKTVTGDCPNDYLPYLVEHDVAVGVCTPCAKARKLDESQLFQNMEMAVGTHLIEMAAEAKIFNF